AQRGGWHAVGVPQLVDEHVVHAGLAEPGHLDPELGVDRMTHLHPALADALRQLAPHRHAEVLRLHDRKDIARAHRDVHRHLARALDLDGLPGQRDVRRRPSQGDLPDPVAVRSSDRLHRTGLGIDQHLGLSARSGHQPGLERRRRRADRALAARHVVAAGVHEEEAEVRGGRHRLGHHRDQQAAVPARLEAEAGPNIVQVLVEPAPLLRDRAAGQAPEAAREQAHADPGGVEVDGPEHAIASHGHLRVSYMSCYRNRRETLDPSWMARIASAKSRATDLTWILGTRLGIGSGTVSVTTSWRSGEASMRSMARPDSPACTTQASTAAAPRSSTKRAASTRVPPLATSSSTTRATLPSTSPMR